MQFAGRGILLDIEGTTSSIHFVYDVMFPFVRRELEGYLRQHWDQPALQATCERIAFDAGYPAARAWFEQPNQADPQRDPAAHEPPSAVGQVSQAQAAISPVPSTGSTPAAGQIAAGHMAAAVPVDRAASLADVAQQRSDALDTPPHVAESGAHRAAVDTTPVQAAQARVKAHVLELMDRDVKATGLKQLQGLIWESGFASGELQAHLYPDVRATLEKWHAAGIDLRIYSSGSIAAQRLFFGHTIEGNLLSLFRGHYDTTTGSKRESTSYQRIAAEFGVPPHEILFLSDVVAELDAARAAGLQTGLVFRPGNPPLPAEPTHPVVRDFSEVRLV
jgi:enolase-phosphatase E1